MEINEIGERGMAIGVHSQEAVEVPRGIHQEVLEPRLPAVGEGVAPDFLTDPDQKRSLGHVLEEIFCILSANDSWFRKEKKKSQQVPPAPQPVSKAGYAGAVQLLPRATEGPSWSRAASCQPGAEFPQAWA